MPTVSASPLANLVEQETLRLARCWELTRADGTVLRFTEHNREIVGPGGNTYTPTDGFQASASQRESGMRDQHFEAVGVLSDSSISRADILAGRYHDCHIVERLLDWRYPWVGGDAIKRTDYWIDRVTLDGQGFKAQVSGVTRYLRPRAGSAFTRSCWKELGSTECGVSLGVFTAAGNTVATQEGDRVTFTSPDPPGAAGLYDRGYVDWDTGGNAGIRSPILTWDAATDTVTLALPTPVAIEVGDTFTIVAGCDKSETECRDTFSNFANFGGWPDLPTTDEVVAAK